MVIDGCCDGMNVGLVIVKGSWSVVRVVKWFNVIVDYYWIVEGLYVIGRLPVLFIILPVDIFNPITSPTKAFSTTKLTVKEFYAPKPSRHPTKFTVGTITWGATSIINEDSQTA